MPTIYDEEQKTDTSPVGSYGNGEQKNLETPQDESTQETNALRDKYNLAPDAEDSEDSKTTDSANNTDFYTPTTTSGAGSQIQTALKNSYYKKIGWSFLGVGAIIVVILFLMSALKIPNYAANIAGYTMARTSLEYAKNSAAIDSEKIAADTVSDDIYKSAYKDKYSKLRSATWGKFDKYRPELTYKNMGTSGTLDYITEPTKTKFGFTRTKITGVRINGQTIITPQERFGRIYSNYAERARFAGELKSSISEALGGYNGLVRSQVSKKIMAKAGIKLKFWDNKGKEYRDAKSAKAADLKMLQDTQKATGSSKNTASAVTQDINEATQAGKDKLKECIDTKPDCGTKLAQTGQIPEEVSKEVEGKLSSNVGKTIIGVVNPLYGIGVPMCLIFDGSLASAEESINNQDSESKAAYIGLQTQREQQQVGDTSAEAVAAGNRKLGNGDSAIDQIMRGETPKTSGEQSPQASPMGDFTIASALLPKDIANTINTGAETLCPKITDVRVAGGVAAVAVVVQFIGLFFGVTEAEVAGQAAIRVPIQAAISTVAKQVTERVVTQVTTKAGLSAIKSGVSGFGKKFTRDFIAIESATILAKLIVYNKMNVVNDATTSTDTAYKNTIMQGGINYSGDLNRQMFNGAPMTNADAVAADKLATAFMKNQDSNLPVYQRYFALSNPRSMLSKIGYQGYFLRSASGTKLLTKITQSLNIGSMLRTFGLVQKSALADDGSVSAYFGIVQWGWTPAEDALRNTDQSYSLLENAKILEESGRVQEIQDKYGECFSEPVGTLLAQGKIVRAENGDVIANEGLCSPQNLGPNNQEGFKDLVFRWRIDNAYNNTLDQQLGIQNPTADNTITAQCSEPQAGNKNIFMVGDSLSDGMATAGLEAKFKTAGWSVVMVHEQGKNLAWGEQQVQANRDAVAQAGTVIVELGTNDGNASNFTERLSSLYSTIHTINPTAKIYWVNYISSKNPGDFVAMSAKLQDFAQANNVSVINWASIGGPFVQVDTAYGVHPQNNYPDLMNFVLQSVQSNAGCSSTSSTGWVWPVKKEDLANWSSLKNNENVGGGLNQCWMHYHSTENKQGYHAAIDINVINKPVYAATSGEVLNDPTDGYNTFIIQSYSSNYYAVYEHMSSFMVKKGDKVTAGQQIGVSGEVGTEGAPHLHFGISTSKERFGVYADPWATVNPLDFLPNDYSPALLKDDDTGSCVTADIKGKDGFGIPIKYQANKGADPRYY